MLAHENGSVCHSEHSRFTALAMNGSGVQKMREALFVQQDQGKRGFAAQGMVQTSEKRHKNAPKTQGLCGKEKAREREEIR